jgi:hypothetical protein
VVNEAMLLELRQNRFNIISEYLTGQAEPPSKRISIITPDILAENPTSTGPAVTINLMAVSQ